MSASQADPSPPTTGGETCNALSLADSQRCDAIATSADGKFCRFHAKQCFGLYKGYKRRNAKLDALIATAPPYLTNSRKKLASQDFADVEDEKLADDLHQYLFQRHALLDQVIRARKLHHKHFYALTMDYGHEKYLNSLITEKRTVSGALYKCYQRMAHLAFQKQKWFKWARECQDEEDERRENEQKKIKREAALFRRRAKELDRRMRERRAKEDAQRQDEFLERAYQDSLTWKADSDDEEGWDPIGDVLEDERDTYIELIKYCLWLDHGVDEAVPGPATKATNSNGSTASANGSHTLDQEPQLVTASKSHSGQKIKKGKGKGKRQSQKPVEEVFQQTDISGRDNAQKKQRSRPVIVQSSGDSKRPEKEPDMAQIESRHDMESRLIQGTKITNGSLVSEDSNGRRKTFDRMPGIPPTEVHRLMDEVAEVKNYLLCRLLLKDAVLLPAAQKAPSLDEFFADPEVKTQDLRDLCLKLEEPQLQDIRDACADFFRVDDADPGLEPEDESSDESEDQMVNAAAINPDSKHPLPEIWRSKREQRLRLAQNATAESRATMVEGLKQATEDHGTKIDFGIVDDAGEFKKANLRVKICGRNIYNYPKQGSMGRRGWFHFSIIAKDCSIWKAIELCKSWDEFFELNILSLHLYFPSPHWGQWAGDMIRSQFLQFGFIPYYYFDDAEKVNVHRDLRSRGYRGQVEHQVRNFMCAQIKRNDPISRRFIQHVSMQTWRMFILVRDGKTGEIIVSPDEEELWLSRIIVGKGRYEEEANWKTLRFVGEQFFEEMDELRNFHLGFADFYDVYIWTADPGVHWQLLHGSILEILHKAHQVCHPLDRWAYQAAVLETLTYEDNSYRVRDIRKDESAKSIWDGMTGDDAFFEWRTPDGHKTREMPKEFVYTEADAIEDSILFPDDSNNPAGGKRFKSVDNDVSRLESGRLRDLISVRFAADLDTDEEPPQELEEILFRGKRRRGVGKGGLMKNPSDTLSKDNEDSSSWEDESESDGESNLDLVVTNPGSPARPQAARSERTYLSGLKATLDAAEQILNSFGPGPEPDADLHTEFILHIDLWKSKVFKESWHKSDFEAGAQEQWQDYLALRSAMEKDRLTLFDLILPCARLLQFLDYHPETHLRVMKDARRAYSIISLFSTREANFFKTRAGSKYKSSRLFNQSERSKHQSNRRGFRSCAFREDAFYTDLEKNLRSPQARNSTRHTLPLAWDVCIRPKIAQLFSNGLIGVANDLPEYAAGLAFAGQEAGKPLDLFFDFRQTIADLKMPPSMVDPYSIPIESLRKDATLFAAERSSARFALLRLWSAPHFYPFMLGYDNRDLSTFVDAVGRVWAWKFLCKDVPFSESSVHTNMVARMEPLRAKLGADSFKIKVRKDVILVMGKDEDELLKLAAAATFTVQTQPWRLEIDFWRSFVNVDLDFLAGLQDEWWA